jgi:hypothetical protein
LLLALVACVAILCFKRQMVEALVEAIDRFRGGGPPTPMHPSPAGDDALLRIRSKRLES